MKNPIFKFIEPKFVLTALVVLCCTLLTAIGRIDGESFQAILVITLGVYAGVSRKKRGEKEEP